MIALTIANKTTYLPDSAQEDAMRRFFEAKQAGDATAELKRVTGQPEPAAPSGESPAPAVAAPKRPVSTSGTTPSGEFSPLAASRIELQEAWLADSGFSMEPPLFAPGTRVLPVGDRNFRLQRRAVESLPLFADAAAEVIALIRNEERRDHTVALKSLSMKEDGTLEIGGPHLTEGRLNEAGLHAAIEAPAFLQLAALGGFAGGARYLARQCGTELRARNVNEQLGSLSPRRQVVLRTREGRRGRSVFAAVTPAYAPVDADQILETVSGPLSDARCQLRYDGAGMHAEALWMPEQVVDLAAGDIFKTGVRISTNDAGRGRIRVSAVVWRNRCLNLLILGQGIVPTLSQVHRGDPDHILRVVGDAVAGARDKVSDFLDAWGHARTVKVEPEDQFRNWVRRGKLKLPGKTDKEQTVLALMDAWRREPGDTLADAVNAVTRAAHEHEPWGQDVRESLELQAASLVYARA